MQVNYSLSPKYRENMKVIVAHYFEFYLIISISWMFERKLFSILGPEGDLDPIKSISGDRSGMIRANSNQRSARLEKQGNSEVFVKFIIHLI